MRHQNGSTRSSSCGGAEGTRLLITLLAAMAFAGALWMGLNDIRCSSMRKALDACKTETVHVVNGDTLWGIAYSHGAQGTSTYEVVEWIKERNGLTTSELRPGASILVPLVAAS